MSKHILYFSNKALEKITLNPAGIEGLNSRKFRLYSIVIDVMKGNIPVLHKVEWLTIMDVSNGLHSSPNYHAPRDMANSFRFSIME